MYWDRRSANFVLAIYSIIVFSILVVVSLVVLVKRVLQLKERQFHVSMLSILILAYTFALYMFGDSLQFHYHTEDLGAHLNPVELTSFISDYKK